MKRKMKRIPSLLILLTALLPALPPAAWAQAASQPLAPKVFTQPAPVPPPPFTPAGQSPQVVAGPAGAKGDKGDPGPGAGYSAALSGVVANTQADQAPALATALLASKAAGTGLVTLPPGLMRLQSPVSITSTGFDGGTRLVGMGINAQLSSARGTTLLMDAASQDAVVRVSNGFMIGGEISDLTLGGHGPPLAADTAYGIHFANTNWTNFRLHRVYIQNVHTAIGADYSGVGNANGENLVVDQCLGQNVTVWYQNTSDQAFAHTEIASGASLLESVSASQYSTVYRLMSLGQNFYSLHGSSSFSTAVNNPLTVYNTFLENVGADQDVHDGGRCEHVGRIVKISGGTPSKISTITIRNYHFTDMVDGSCLVEASSVNGQFNIVFEDCEFDSPTAGGSATPTATLNVLRALNGDPNARIILRHPRFSGFKTIILGAAPTAGHYAGVLYDDGWQMGAVGALTPVSNLSSTGTAIAAVNN